MLARQTLSSLTPLPTPSLFPVSSQDHLQISDTEITCTTQAVAAEVSGRVDVATLSGGPAVGDVIFSYRNLTYIPGNQGFGGYGAVADIQTALNTGFTKLLLGPGIFAPYPNLCNNMIVWRLGGGNAGNWGWVLRVLRELHVIFLRVLRKIWFGVCSVFIPHQEDRPQPLDRIPLLPHHYAHTHARAARRWRGNGRIQLDGDGRGASLGGHLPRVAGGLVVRLWPPQRHEEDADHHSLSDSIWLLEDRQRRPVRNASTWLWLFLYTDC